MDGWRRREHERVTEDVEMVDEVLAYQRLPERHKQRTATTNMLDTNKR